MGGRQVWRKTTDAVADPLKDIAPDDAANGTIIRYLFMLTSDK